MKLMARRVKFVFVLFSFGLLGITAFGRQNEIDPNFSTIQNGWRIVESSLENPHSWKITSEFTDHDRTSKSQMIMQFKDRKLFSHILIPNDSPKKYYGQTWTFNDEYAFYAEPRAPGQWALMELRFPISDKIGANQSMLADKSHFESYFRRLLFPLSLRSTLSLQDLGSNPELTITKLEDLGETTILGIRWDSRSSNEVVEIEATLSNDNFYLPMKVVGKIVAPSNSNISYLITLSDFETFGAIKFPTKAVHLIDKGYTREIDSSWDLVNFSWTKPNASEFTLEKFGLVTPDAIKNNRRMRPGPYFAIFVCSVVVLILWFKFGSGLKARKNNSFIR